MSQNGAWCWSMPVRSSKTAGNRVRVFLHSGSRPTMLKYIVCRMCLYSKRNKDSMLSREKKADKHCLTKTPTNLMHVWKTFKQIPRLIYSPAVACWYTAPCYIVQSWLCFPCCVHVKAPLYLQSCSSVDDTISNLLSHALFERVHKLKCRMLFLFHPLPTLRLCVSVSTLTQQCAAASMTLSLIL